MSPFSLTPVPLGSSLLDEVWSLYRKHSATLGFLPRGALEEFAHAGCVLAATRGEELLGYTAWRRSQKEAVLVHLCVAEIHRGGDVADTLLRNLIEHCREDMAIRLRCRKDYEAANRVWPRHGFIFVNEIAGRGADATPLLEWRRVQHEPPLFQMMEAAMPRAAYVVAMDANVYFDIRDPNSIHHEESRVLLAEWLDDVDVCVTRELRNEVARQSDDSMRQSMLASLRRFKELAVHADELEQALEAIANVLPPPCVDADYSDRRQLVHAWKGGADFFATRDTTLLDHADDLRAVTGLAVMRPTDVVARLQGDFLGADYAPIRLHGTQVERRAAMSENDLLPFQRFAARESKAAWLRAIRAARASPDQCTVELVGAQGELPRVAFAVDRSRPGSLHIVFLRTLSGPLTGTLLRRVLADVIESARHHQRKTVTVGDPEVAEIREALMHVGFENHGDGQLVRYTLHGMVSANRARTWIHQQLPEARFDPDHSASELESRFWPLKIVEAEIPTYIVPIRPRWATELFDRHLAVQELFGVPEGPALALENIYYSASNISIPEGSRILWYVSGKVNELRAVSSCLGTDTDSATRLSRRYHRLGVYRWQDILSAAKSDPRGRLRAYRFARTELLERPVPWRRLKDLIWRHMGTRNTLASPLRVPEDLFIDAYREGMKEAYD